MQTLSVNLLHEAESLKDLAAQYPGVSLHLIHLAVLRVGIGAARQDHKIVETELARIQGERRIRRQSAGVDQGGPR